jgi:hypothetical protein
MVFDSIQTSERAGLFPPRFPMRRGQPGITPAEEMVLPPRWPAEWCVFDWAISAILAFSMSRSAVCAPPLTKVITVCDRASETRPVFPGATQRIHSGVSDDPSPATRTNEQQLRAFREGIQHRLRMFPDRQREEVTQECMGSE